MATIGKKASNNPSLVKIVGDLNGKIGFCRTHEEGMTLLTTSAIILDSFGYSINVKLSGEEMEVIAIESNS